jgi:hypothetical protein
LDAGEGGAEGIGRKVPPVHMPEILFHIGGTRKILLPKFL